MIKPIRLMPITLLLLQLSCHPFDQNPDTYRLWAGIEQGVVGYSVWTSDVCPLLICETRPTQARFNFLKTYELPTTFEEMITFASETETDAWTKKRTSRGEYEQSLDVGSYVVCVGEDDRLVSGDAPCGTFVLERQEVGFISVTATSFGYHFESSDDIEFTSFAVMY